MLDTEDPSTTRRALALLVAIGLSACSSSSGGGGGNGGSSSTFPSGPALACEPGDIDLGATTGPGLSVLALGELAVDQSITVFGGAAFGSAPVSLCVPPDAVSLALYGDPALEVLPISWVGSGLGQLIESSTPQAMSRSVTPELSLPKSPDVALRDGRHTFVLAADAPITASPHVAIRRGQRSATSTFPINIVLVSGCGIDESNAQAFGDGASVFDQIYAQANVAATPAGLGRIDDAALSVISKAAFGTLAGATPISSPEAPLVDGGVNLYLVRELLSDDTAGTLLGSAMGIPGVPHLLSRRGVVLSVDAHRNGLDVDFRAMWVTAAHEIGHWHGLRHTTERWGTPQDFILDTPECTIQNDFDKNGLVDSFECAGRGADNVMFWTYDLSDPPTRLVAGQAFVLHSAFTMSPG